MMNLLLLLFALPFATIVISVALQKILDNPILVAAIIFSIFLVITFVVGDLNLLIATIIYTIISFITAVIVNYIKENMCDSDDNDDANNHQSADNQQNQCRRRRRLA